MRRRYWIVFATLAVAVAATSGAVAATKLQSRSDRSKAVINDAAQRLNVTPGALSTALRKALDDQVDAAVAAGRLTKQQGDALKAHLASGHMPLFGGLGREGFGGRFGPWHRPEGRMPGVFGPGLHAVTSYLGMTPPQLRRALASGKSLAQVAADHGKTAAGLVDALFGVAKPRLDRAVRSGHLSAEQEQSILARLRSMFEGVVHHTAPGIPGEPLFHFHSHPHFGVPPGNEGNRLGPPATAAPQL